MTNHLDLIRTYEPVLMFSKDGEGNCENFFPLAAEHFVQECGLRRGKKGWVHAPGQTLLKHLSEVQRSEECYLVYAAGDLPDSDKALSLLDLAYELEPAWGEDRVTPQFLIDRDAADALKEGFSILAGVEWQPPDIKEVSEWLISATRDPSTIEELETALGLSLTSDLLGGPQALATHLDTEMAAAQLRWALPFFALPAPVLDKAKKKYEWCREQYPPVYHHHVYEDEERSYRVLEYWFLYACNDWHAHGGINDHEGDWEVIYVFLDNRNIPQWVAYSRHIKFPTYKPLKARWADVEKVKGDTGRATHPIVYVGCGSHANYLKKGRWPVLLKTDYAEGNDVVIGPGTDQPWGTPIRLDDKPWNKKFKGKWGASLGQGPPTGPAQKGDKWDDPAKWAEIPPCP